MDNEKTTVDTVFKKAAEDQAQENYGDPVCSMRTEAFLLGADFGRDYAQNEFQNVPHGTIRIPHLGVVK